MTDGALGLLFVRRRKATRYIHADHCFVFPDELGVRFLRSNVSGSFNIGGFDCGDGRYHRDNFDPFLSDRHAWEMLECRKSKADWNGPTEANRRTPLPPGTIIEFNFGVFEIVFVDRVYFCPISLSYWMPEDSSEYPLHEFINYSDNERRKFLADVPTLHNLFKGNAEYYISRRPQYRGMPRRKAFMQAHGDRLAQYNFCRMPATHSYPSLRQYAQWIGAISHPNNQPKITKSVCRAIRHGKLRITKASRKFLKSIIGASELSKLINHGKVTA